jgi:hypothetical protein
MRIVYHANKREPNMKPFTVLAAFVFALVAVLQLVRFVMEWEITVNGMMVPVWASGVAFVVAAGLAVMLVREARR